MQTTKDIIARLAEPSDYLEPSTVLEDRGELVGRDPRSLRRETLQTGLVDLGWSKSPIRAIRTKCLDCTCSNRAEIRKCTATACPLWPFRMGVNVFYGKSGVEE